MYPCLPCVNVWWLKPSRLVFRPRNGTQSAVCVYDPLNILCSQTFIHCPPNLQDKYTFENDSTSTFSKFAIKKCSDFPWHPNITCFDYCTVFCHQFHFYSFLFPRYFPWSIYFSQGNFALFYRQCLHLFYFSYLHYLKDKEIFPKDVEWQFSNTSTK